MDCIVRRVEGGWVSICVGVRVCVIIIRIVHAYMRVCVACCVYVKQSGVFSRVGVCVCVK